MTSITLWQAGTMKCVLVFEGLGRQLRLTDRDQILRSLPLLMEDDARTIAERWRIGSFIDGAPQPHPH